MKRSVICAALAAVSMLMCSKSKPPEGAAVGVNGEWIMSRDVDYMSELIKQEAMRYSPAAALENMTAEFRKNAARQLVAEKLMLQEAGKRKIEVQSEKFDTLFSQFLTQIGGQMALSRMLVQAGQTEEEFKDRMRKSMVMDSLVGILVASADTVDSAKCMEYYNQNAAKFREREKMRASQVLVLAGADMPADKKAAAKSKAEKALAEIKSGKDFRKVAKTYSDDPNAKTGGDIGWFVKGDMKPEIDQVVASMDSGQVSEIVTTDIGYHIFKKTGEQMSKPLEYKQVADNIRITLEMRKKNDVIMGAIDSLIKVSKIVYADTTLKM
jgi:parvulin-like peptidyl-prolyl isomerase